MKIIDNIKAFLKSRICGPSPLSTADYVADGLAVWNKSMGFMSNEYFIQAYRRGQFSGHKLTGSKTKPLRIEWRVHVAISMALHAAKLPGDFVECGVNTGVLSLAICDFLNFNLLNKYFYLYDTYQGIPYEQITPEEDALGRSDENLKLYENCYELTKANFAPFKNAILVKGVVPSSLINTASGKVCYLSLDMNIAAPEIAALHFFWEMLSPGAPVLFDDYGWKPYLPQKKAIDAFASEHGVAVCELPTGQGLLIKPPSAS
jgi:O-methyltransferase